MQASERSLPLACLEDWLVTVSTDPGGAAAGVARAGALPGIGAVALETVVTAGPRLTALERLAIYNEGYFARLVECLRDDYPAVAHALGEPDFERLAREYIGAHPSRSPSLNAFGASLPAYLETRSEAWAPFAAELSRLEWALVEVIHAETLPALEQSALGAVLAEEWPGVRFVPSPALRLLDFTYPVNGFYQAFRDELDPVAPEARSSSVVVHRSGFSVYRLELEPVMRVLLGELLAGKTLGAALGELERRLSSEELAQAQAELSAWFSAWVAAGFFVALERA